MNLVIMVHQCRLIRYNRHTTLVEDVDRGGDLCVCVKAGSA